MARIAPFRALRFDVGRVGDLGAVWAPPYDVIGVDMARELRARHPNNIVRLTNPEGEGPKRYAAAADTLAAWVTEGVLARDDRPSFYVHTHTFSFHGVPRVRSGLWALLELEPLDMGAVLPHERTMSGPRADRLALMRACRAQLSPIFFICTDPAGRIREALRKWSGDAAGSVEFPAGERHELCAVTEAAAMDRLAALLEEQVLLIADGHHRYETALAYRDELIANGAPRSGRHPHEFVLAYLVPEDDPGLLLLPTHRIVEGEPVDWSAAIERTEDRFEVRRLGEAELAAANDLLEEERGRAAFILLARGDAGGWLLRLRPEAAAAHGVPTPLAGIASLAFHEVFLPGGLGLGADAQGERVGYSRDPDEAMRSVRVGAAGAAALLAPPSVAQVREAARAGERTPPKTTYFWPKVPTGVAVHAIDPEEEVAGVGDR